MKVGLYFGSFNPVHVGHMIIANQILSFSDLDQIWMIVSPHNPLKKKRSLANDFDRLHLVNLAIGDNLQIKASNVEFGLPKPSYTIDTLVYLKEKHPSFEFRLIMGGDNLISFPKWKNHQLILEQYGILVYLRRDTDLSTAVNHPNISLLSDLPLLDISSTYIRKCLKKGISVQYLVPDAVFQYLEGSNMYRR
ncbi:MAG: nicotinate-nucleotide adenylyltransferase [Saprospiraceae bacterium]|nr:nicotinate-nucleotide adenylyltransferase [Saprospiraceae bacterium]